MVSLETFGSAEGARKFGDVVIVKGFVQVTDMVGWCDADHTAPLMAGRVSGTQSLRVLARSLNAQLVRVSEDGIRAERVDNVHN